MTLLLKADYTSLEERAIVIEEDEEARFVVFKGVPLPDGLYQARSCDVLVVIPKNYNHDGNDMFWTHPRLVLANGSGPTKTNNEGDGDNRTYKGRTFCRWSRHWSPGSKGAWRPGKDDVVSIYRRVEWALQNPNV